MTFHCFAVRFSVMSAGNKSADEAVSDALLEKFRTHAAKPQEAGDVFRTIVAKIHARVTSSGMHFTLHLKCGNFVFQGTPCAKSIFFLIICAFFTRHPDIL